MRKIYLLPNLVTTGNIFCGFMSLTAAARGDFKHAAWMIMLAGVFDMMDGRIARLARATSAFGVQYDSLSDMISFGLAPAFLMYHWKLQPFDRLGWMVCFLYVVAGAFRLARFNVNSEVLPKGYFQGLPIPMAAGLVTSFSIFAQAQELSVFLGEIVLSLTLILAVFMVSTIPFPSFKDFNWRSRASFGYLIGGVVALVLIALRPELALFGVGALYIVLSLVWNILRSVRRTEEQEQKGT